MSIDKDLIHRLTLEELAQVISDEDLVYLKTIIRENTEAFNIWIETRAVLNTPDVLEFLARRRSVEDIFLQHPPNSGTDYRAFSLSLAALLIVSLGLYLLLPLSSIDIINKAQINLSDGAGSWLHSATIQELPLPFTGNKQEITYPAVKKK